MFNIAHCALMASDWPPTLISSPVSALPSAGGREIGGMTAQEDLKREILKLTEIIETNRAALRLPTVSKADKAQLLLALDRRKARLALLQEQLAALPQSN
jgi:hypothetical protein